MSYGEMLKKVSLFANVEEAELERISSLLSEVDVKKDAAIISRDTAGDSLYVILRGRVKIVIQGDGGREVILNLLKTGDFFGEMALLDDLPRSADVVASEDSKLLVLRRDQFAEHIRKSPATALNVMGELSRRLRRADELISNLALLDVYSRVAHIIIDLAKKDGVDVEEGILIRDRPTQQDIASMIGTSRETVSRVLSEFQKRGFVEMRGRDILLSRTFTGAAVAARDSSV
ncbi:MAG: Crp/Fnr family transcriptional regulator [Deltaproteobacteria bacterium]|nr:Crp/Fnr family transcriptional regulator [Deltaproteobacteria bacterium]